MTWREPATTGTLPRAQIRRWRRWTARISVSARVETAIVCAYLVAAVVIMKGLWESPNGRGLVYGRGDQSLFAWMLMHGVDVFTHGADPLTTSMLNVPSSVNLMANTSILSYSLPLAPLTAWLGPQVVFALLVTLGLAGTAYAWYYVMYRHFVGDRVAAVVGGAICGFGPGLIAHANGHPNLVGQFLVPLILARVLDLRQSVRPVKDGLIIAALIVVQAFIAEEILLDVALGGAVFVVGYLIFRPSAIRYAAPIARGLGVAALASAVLLAYPLWVEFTAPGHVTGLPLYQSNFPYTAALADYVTLPGGSLFGDPQSAALLAGTSEQNSFFGWPVVIVAVLIVVALWVRVPVVRPLAIVALLFTWASLGAAIHLGPATSVNQGSLWQHLETLPLFNSVLPIRLGLVVLPVIGLLFAYAIAAARTMLGEAKPRAILVRAAACVALTVLAAALITIIPRPVATVDVAPAPAFFTSGQWRHYVPSGYTVLPAEPKDKAAPLRWSVATGLQLPVAAGYFFVPDSSGRARYGPIPRPTQNLLGWVQNGHFHKPTVAQTNDMVADLQYWRTAAIVLVPADADQSATTNLLDHWFGQPTVTGGVLVWNALPLTKGSLPPVSAGGVPGAPSFVPGLRRAQ